MTSDAEQRFNIDFAGECLEGHAPERVRAGVAALFKADDAALAKLFSGKRQRIKRGCDKATAIKYQKAMAKVGARALITASDDAISNTVDEAAGTPAGNAAAAASAAVDLSLAPAGSDVLQPDEREIVAAPALDLGHLSVADAGETLTEAAPETAPSAAVPDLEVAEAGTRLGPEASGVAPEVPDTSAIDLAPEGQDFSDCAPPPRAEPPPNTDHLSVADSGSELLEASERKQDTARPPDTSHLSVDSPATGNPFLNSDP